MEVWARHYSKFEEGSFDCVVVIDGGLPKMCLLLIMGNLGRVVDWSTSHWLLRRRFVVELQTFPHNSSVDVNIYHFVDVLSLGTRMHEYSIPLRRF